LCDSPSRNQETFVLLIYRPLIAAALVLAPLAVAAQPATAPSATSSPAAPQSAVSLVDPAAVQALKAMGTHLQTLKRFQVSTQVTGERVLADGQKLQHTARAVLDVARPSKLHARMETARAQRDLFYDGKTATLYTPEKRYYSSVEFAGTLGGLMVALRDRYGFHAPLADLFEFGTPDAPLEGIESAMNAGQELVGNDLCDHYAFRQGKLDWQIWIRAKGDPLPRKIVITSRTDESRPQSVSVIDWNLKPRFSDAVFKFTPPRGSTQVEFVPLKTR
jgi:hypothetical protein